MNKLKQVLKMIQLVQCECLGTEMTISIFTNKKYFTVHVQRSDLDYSVVYSEKFYSTDTQSVNVKKFATLYAFVVDEAYKIGYTLTGSNFTKVENCCEVG